MSLKEKLLAKKLKTAPVEAIAEVKSLAAAPIEALPEIKAQPVAEAALPLPIEPVAAAPSSKNDA